MDRSVSFALAMSVLLYANYHHRIVSYIPESVLLKCFPQGQVFNRFKEVGFA